MERPRAAAAIELACAGEDDDDDEEPVGAPVLPLLPPDDVDETPVLFSNDEKTFCASALSISRPSEPPAAWLI